MQDPFFASRRRAEGNQWGKHTGYVEDVHRTYGKKLPERNNKAFKEALQFREREKAMYKQIHSERDLYAQELQNSTKQVTDLTKQLRLLSTQFSRLKEEHERTSAGSKRSSSIPSVSDEQGSDAKGASKELDGSTVLRGQPDGAVQTTPDAIDSCGSSSEHGAEGRHAGGSDDKRSVSVCEGTVPEGGEGSARG